MKHLTLSALIALVLIRGMSSCYAEGEPASEFNETTIRTMQDAWALLPEFQATVQQFETSNDPVVKAAKWKAAVVAAAEGLLSATWPTPSGGWKLLAFPATGNLTLEDVQDQQSEKASYTKLVAQNETEAVRLRGAQALILSAALEGEQWGEKLLLDIAQRPDSNIKRLTYWFTKYFAQDWHTQGESATGAPVWPVNWAAWQQAYNAANALGKAIILKNVTMLAARRNDFAVAATINLSALSGTDRELKAIALAFGDPSLGSAVTAKWAEIAGNASDPQMQALAQEVRGKFGITD